VLPRAHAAAIFGERGHVDKLGPDAEESPPVGTVGRRARPRAWQLLVLLSVSGACGGGDQHPATLTGTLLAPGDLDLAGITTDDVAAVLDRDRGALAVPVGGGAPQVVDPASDGVTAGGSVIFSYSNLDVISGFGDLTVWTSAFGAVPFATGATFLLAVSSDGTRVLATQGSSSDGTTTNLIVGAADGSPPAMVGAISRLGSCEPRVRFGAHRFLVSRCAPGSTTITISSIDPQAGTMTDLLSPAKAVFAAVPGGGELVLVVGADGAASLVPEGGGSPTPVAAGVEALIVSPDGTAVFARGGGLVQRIPADGSPPLPLQQGVAVMRGFSPDGQWFVFGSMLGPRDGYSDLLLASATASLPPQLLSPDTDSATLWDAFTADASRVLYVTRATDLLTGHLQSQPVGGGSVTAHGDGVWAVRATAGARIVFNDQYVAVPKRPGRAVLRAVDTAGAARPTTIATDAGADFFLTQARDRVVFSFDDGSDRAGLYVAPLP
jgi:hypothetical protein